MDYNYCPLCGNTLSKKDIGDEGIISYCEQCKIPWFNNPASCVIILILNNKNQVLLLKQNYISKLNWTLCSGYVKNGETLEETAEREVKEETNQDVINLKYISSYYYRPKELIMSGYIAYVNVCEFSDSKEVDDLMWVNIDEVNKYIGRVNNFLVYISIIVLKYSKMGQYKFRFNCNTLSLFISEIFRI